MPKNQSTREHLTNLSNNLIKQQLILQRAHYTDQLQRFDLSIKALQMHSYIGYNLDLHFEDGTSFSLPGDATDENFMLSFLMSWHACYQRRLEDIAAQLIKLHLSTPDSRTENSAESPV